MNNLNLKSIQTIITDSCNAGSIEKAIELTTLSLQHLASIMAPDTTLREAFLFACVFHKTIEDPNEKLLKFIANHLQCSKLELLDIYEDLLSMKKNGFIMGGMDDTIKSKRNADFDFNVNFKIINKIRKGESLIDKPQLKQKNFKRLMDVFHELVFEKSGGDITQEIFEQTTMNLLYENKDLPQVQGLFQLYENQDQSIHQKFNQSEYNHMDNYHPNHDYLVTLYAIYHMIKTEKLEINYEYIINWCLGDEASFNRIIDIVGEKKHPLIIKEIISDAMFNLKENKLTFVFTDYGLDYLLGDERATIAPIVTGQSMKEILPSNIPERKLFFSGELNKQLQNVSKLLAPEVFEDVQRRMQVFLKTTSIGVCIMLHGEPGTGKTEYVLQIARQTNRPIFKVDISSTKNMYYGESEKMIKRIFTDYNNMLMGTEVTPILFINEADALISKRVDVTRSIDQTNNSIQNILLDELENFRGILIITTNLVTNMDKAFERRFLMKIKFEKAHKEAQQQIWKEKLPQLQEQEIEKLLPFDLSPALIDNVAKKAFIKTLIDGETNFEDIQNFCVEENFSTSNKKIIGF